MSDSVPIVAMATLINAIFDFIIALCAIKYLR